MAGAVRRRGWREREGGWVVVRAAGAACVEIPAAGRGYDGSWGVGVAVAGAVRRRGGGGAKGAGWWFGALVPRSSRYPRRGAGMTDLEARV